jgi:hypothetical protein
MPMSVTTPVRCVVRTTAPEIRVTSAFCSPIAKLSMQVSTAVPTPALGNKPALKTVNATSTAASTKSAPTYRAFAIRRALSTSAVAVTAPARKTMTRNSSRQARSGFVCASSSPTRATCPLTCDV